MPRSFQTPADYYDQLAAAARGAKPGAVVSAAGLARTAGVTWRVIERWMRGDDEFPVRQRGATGTAWQFDAKATLDHLARRAREARADRAEPQQARSPEDSAAHYRALKAGAEAAMVTQRLKREQGMYVPASVFAAIMAEVMTTMQTETLSAAARLDPAGRWPVEVREGVDDAMRDVLVTVRDRLDSILSAHDLGAAVA